MSKRRNIFISAAERSGDAHASRLVREILRRGRAVHFTGFGGELLAAAGCELIEEAAGRASMGVGFLKHLGSFFRTIRRFDRMLRDDPPSAVVLVDSPGLHFLFARLARWRGVPVIYYICPQIWAWAPWRLAKVLRYTDLLLPILPFEETVYRNDRVPVVHVGHPLAEALAEIPADAGDRLRQQLGVKTETRVIGVLPGSRTQEVEGLIPLFRAIIDRLELDPGAHHILVSCFRSSFRETIEGAMAGCRLPCDVVDADSRAVAQASDLVLVASGTATLEVAWFEKPMVALYHGRPWLHLAQKTLGVIPFFALPNILGAALFDGESVVPERLCRGDEADDLTPLVRSLLEDQRARRKMVERLREVKARVLVPGASRNAADAVLGFLDGLGKDRRMTKSS